MKRRFVTAEVLFVGGVTRTYFCQKELQSEGNESLTTTLRDGRLLVLDDRKVLGVVYGMVEVDEPDEPDTVEEPLRSEEDV